MTDIATADPKTEAPTTFVVWRRKKPGRWEKVGAADSWGEAMQMTYGSGDWRIEEVPAAPTTPTLFDTNAEGVAE